MRLRAAGGGAVRRGATPPTQPSRAQLRIQLQLPNSNWVPTVRAPRTALCGGVGPSGRRIAMCVKARRGVAAGGGCRLDSRLPARGACRGRGAADLTRTMGPLTTVNLIVVKFVRRSGARTIRAGARVHRVRRGRGLRRHPSARPRATHRSTDASAVSALAARDRAADRIITGTRV
jgi:hypothetical protein